MNNNLQKGFVIPVIVAIVVAVLILGGFFYYSSKANETKKMAEEKAMMEKKIMEQKEQDAMMEKKDGEVVKDDSMMEKKEEGMMVKYSGTILAGTSAPLLDFVKADYNEAIKTDKLVILYFYANWCPICKAEFPKMQEAFNGLSTDKVVGFRVNYNDNQTDNDERNLAKEFGVAYQHTKVFVKNGQRVLKSPESWDKSRYESEINKALAQ